MSAETKKYNSQKPAVTEQDKADALLYIDYIESFLYPKDTMDSYQKTLWYGKEASDEWPAEDGLLEINRKAINDLENPAGVLIMASRLREDPLVQEWYQATLASRSQEVGQTALSEEVAIAA